jgi:four helix bundle protein
MPKSARRHEDLIAWQLCSELRRLVLQATRRGPVAREYDYRRQLRTSARSACYLTSEGFYRYEHGEFGNFLNLAHGSLGETLDQINQGLDEQYFSSEQHLAMKRVIPQHPDQFRLGTSTGNSSRSPHSFHDPT